MKKWLFFVLMILTAQAPALLPPLYTSLAEFKALIDSPELTQRLESGEVILSIQRTKEGLAVITNKHILLADLEALPSDKPGPAQFKLTFHTPTPRDSSQQK